MNSWKVHLGWGLVVFVLAVGLIRALATDNEAEHRRPDEKLRDRIAAHESTISLLKAELALAKEEADGLKTSVPEPLVESESSPSPERGRPETNVEPRRNSEEQRSRREPLTAEQIRSLIRGESRGNRWQALRAIESIEDREEKLALLQEMIASGDSSMRDRALRMLGDLGGTEAIDALLAAYRSEDLRTRARAAVALNRLGQAGPVQEMIPAVAQMLNNQDGAIREDGVKLLGRLGTINVLPYLEQALRDSNSKVREEAVDALKDTGLEEAIPILTPLLNDPDQAIARDAQRAIERIQNPERDRGRNRGR